MQHNVIKINSTGDKEHLFVFDSTMKLVPMWPGEKQKSNSEVDNEQRKMRSCLFKRCARNCYKLFSVRKNFLLKSLSRSSGKHTLQQSPAQLSVGCENYCSEEVYLQPGWDVCSVEEMLLVFTLIVVYALIVVWGNVCMCYIHGWIHIGAS